MKRAFAVTAALLIALTALFLAGCPRAVSPPPDNKPRQETPAPGEKPPETKPPAQKEPSAGPGRYFPLTLGSTWEYQGEGNEYATFNREVIFAGGKRAQIREDNGGTVMAAVFEVTDDAVTRVFSQGEVYDRVNLLERQANDKTSILKSPLQVGTKWKETGGEREIVDVSATINTPAGVFEKCIRVKIAGQDSTVYEYFSEGVGMVKREFISGETRVTSTLKKYNVKK